MLVLLSLIAHAAAAGSIPGGPALLGGIVVAAALAWPVAARQRSVAWLATYLLVGQLLIHVSMVALGHHGVSYLPESGMVAAHAGVALVAALLFARGEQIVQAWLRAAARLLGAPRVRRVPIPGLTVFSNTERIVIFDRFLTASTLRRGPPLRIGAPTFA